MLAVDDDEREMPVELRVGPGDRVDEVALVVALDEMGDDLGVGLRAERVALLDQRVPAARGSSRRSR